MKFEPPFVQQKNLFKKFDFQIPYGKLGHTCTDPFRVMEVTDVESDKFTSNLYSTVITVFTYVLPVRSKVA
jgi:hypothetical protein